MYSAKKDRDAKTQGMNKMTWLNRTFSKLSLLPFIFVAASLISNAWIQSAGRKGKNGDRVVNAAIMVAGEMQSAAPVSQPFPLWFPKAVPLPTPQGEVILAATVDDMFTAVEHLRPGGTILLADGHYRLPRVIILEGKKDFTIRSAAGDPARVSLIGRGWDSEAKGDDILHIARCEGVTIADLTFTDCRSYGIKVEAENAPKDIRIYNCWFRDIGVRAIKGSAGQDPNVRAMKGSVRYCHFENTKVPPSDWLFGGDYIAAIDMMAL